MTFKEMLVLKPWKIHITKHRYNCCSCWWSNNESTTEISTYIYIILIPSLVSADQL